MFPISFISDSVTLGQTMALAHYNRVTSDGGVVPAGVTGLSSILNSVISAYSITSSSDFATKVPVFLDPHYTGYKLGAGSGTTLGQAATKVYAISSNADVTQATAASQPLLLAHSGTNYWWGSGVAANRCSTPDAAANRITGDIDIKVKIQLSDVLNGSNLYGVFYGKGSQNFWYDFRSSNYRLIADLIGISNVTSGTPISAGSLSSINGVRFVLDTANLKAKFYTSTNYDSDVWTQLGSDVSVSSGQTFPNSGVVEVSAYAGGSFPATGRFYRVKVANSIGGTPVVDFNPASYNASVSQTGWTSATGEAWTINQATTADTLRGVLVNRTIIQGLGTIAGYNLTSAITRPSLMTNYLASTFFEDEISNPIYGPSGLLLTAAISYYSGGIRSMTDNSNGGVNVTANLKQLYCITALYKAAGSTLALNNGASSLIAGTDTGGVSTGLGLLKGNQVFNTLLLSSLEDNTTQRTTVYGIVKSMNGNAF